MQLIKATNILALWRGCFTKLLLGVRARNGKHFTLLSFVEPLAGWARLLKKDSETGSWAGLREKRVKQQRPFEGSRSCLRQKRQGIPRRPRHVEDLPRRHHKRAARQTRFALLACPQELTR